MTVNTTQWQPIIITAPNDSHSSLTDNFKFRPQKFPAAGALPCIPVRHCTPHNSVAPPVIVRNMVPVFSAPPLPSPQPPLVMSPQALGAAPPVSVRQAVPVFSAPVCKKELPRMHPVAEPEEPPSSRAAPG